MQAQNTLALSVTECAARIGVSPRTVWNLIRNGELKVLSIGRRKIITLAELQKFLSRDHPTMPGEAHDGH